MRIKKEEPKRNRMGKNFSSLSPASGFRSLSRMKSSMKKIWNAGIAVYEGMLVYHFNFFPSVHRYISMTTGGTLRFIAHTGQ